MSWKVASKKYDFGVTGYLMWISTYFKLSLQDSVSEVTNILIYNENSSSIVEIYSLVYINPD